MCDGGEVWKRLTVAGKVVGTHPSLARFWLSEVVSAMEHMHNRGLVHRDLKVSILFCFLPDVCISLEFATFFSELSNHIFTFFFFREKGFVFDEPSL